MRCDEGSAVPRMHVSLSEEVIAAITNTPVTGAGAGFSRKQPPLGRDWYVHGCVHRSAGQPHVPSGGTRAVTAGVHHVGGLVAGDAAPTDYSGVLAAAGGVLILSAGMRSRPDSTPRQTPAASSPGAAGSAGVATGCR